MNIRNTEDLSARVRIGLTPGPKPVWGELEVQLCDFIRAQHKLRRQVTRIFVLHKALQINPQFCGGVLDPLFMKRATGFYYRFIHRRQNMLSIQRAGVGSSSKWVGTSACHKRKYYAHARSRRPN